MINRCKTIKHIGRILFNSLIGASTFMFLGWAIPYGYYRFLDKTVYYEIQSPIEIEGDGIYQPCEIIKFEMYRKSIVDTTSDTSVQLQLIKDDQEVIVEFTTLNGIISDTKGKYVPISLYKKLSCDLSDGVYYFKGIAKYKVRDIEKVETFYTDNFMIESHF